MIARNLWELVFSCSGLHQMMPSSVSYQLSVWEGLFRRRTRFKVFRAILHANVWLKGKWLTTLFFWQEEVFSSSMEVIDFGDSLFLGCD